MTTPILQRWLDVRDAWQSGGWPWVFRSHGWFLARQLLNLGAWCWAIYLAWIVGQNGLTCRGEVTCDFAGQWLMGRMFAAGQADKLFIVEPQREQMGWGYKDPKDCNEMVKDILCKGMEHVPSKPQVEPLALLPAADPLWPALVPPLDLMDSVLVRKDYHPAEPLVEGPLYPPTAGLLFMPLGWLEPKRAHALMCFFYTFAAFGSAIFISLATKRRLLAGEAAALVLTFPNYLQAILLGQNSLLTLLILSAGWFAFTRKRPLLCGLIWGLLAYKPVFAVSLLLVPLALPSVRVLVGMVLGGGGFVLLTLPFVGTQGLDRLVTQNEQLRRFVRNDDVKCLLKLDQPLVPIDYLNWEQTNPWERWLAVGKHAAHMYTYDKNWIWMSRDLTGLPFRDAWTQDSWATQMHYLRHRYFNGVDSYHSHHIEYCTTEDFRFQTLQSVQGDDEEHSLARLGLLLIGGVAAATCLLAWVSRLFAWWFRLPSDSALEVDRQAFILAGALLTVFHFMHYDVLVFVLPAALALSNLARYDWLSRGWIVLTVAAFLLCYLDLWYPAGVTRFPVETGCALLLWGGLLLRLIGQCLRLSLLRWQPGMEVVRVD